jgi:hypothetical protein
MYTHSKQCASLSPRPAGFGLIGLLIVVALLLLFTFGYQKASHKAGPDADETEMGSYQPIGTGDVKGQLQTGLEAKQKASDAVKNVQGQTQNRALGIE